jgi:hypothetical protein
MRKEIENLTSNKMILLRQPKKVGNEKRLRKGDGNKFVKKNWWM